MPRRERSAAVRKNDGATLCSEAQLWQLAESANAATMFSSWTLTNSAAWLDRAHQELTADDIVRITRTNHAWRGAQDADGHKSDPDSCRSATLEELRKHGRLLTLRRYVGAEAAPDAGESFEETMKRLVGAA
jgi:hypothetical protein